ncbi:MAG TPA: MogA/MoaB family molybdenum cofactor biosynthesis protein [Rectinemataceae bacterium]|nr:MogA/MoaB family molybdenum cofactor biosynthesis protein [Rectinemataceae bacterium]
MKIAVVTISDRASKGVYEDRSGPAIEATLRELLPPIEVERDLVPDEKPEIIAALARHPDADWIITTGGTGPSPRDVTPEATREYCDRSMPGIADFLRSKSLDETPHAVFSRGEAGMRGAQYVVNFPGSERAARSCAAWLAPLLDHGVKMARGEGH